MRTTVFLVALLLPAFVVAQPSPVLKASWFATAGLNQTTPFWLAANQHGLIDRTGPSTGVTVDYHVSPYGPSYHFHDATRPAAPFAYGASVAARASDRSTLHLHQLYGSVRVAFLELKAGQWHHQSGLVDPTLSMGSMLISGNAAPMPMVKLSTTRFINIPGTWGFLALGGHILHGWFGSGRYINNAWLHEKAGYVRILPETLPIHIYAGLIHDAMWAGTHPDNGPLPRSLADFWRVFIGDRTLGEDDPSIEIAGNTNALGAYDFYGHWHTKTFDILLYTQFYFEDNPGVQWRSAWDSMWGAGLKWKDKTRLVHGLRLERLATLRQGSRYDQGERRGADNYYNHGVFLDGWTYRGRTLGHPLLFADGLRMGVVNNILTAYHLGLEGAIGRFQYRAMATYSRNHGASVVFDAPGSLNRIPGKTERRDQLAGLFELSGALSERRGLAFVTAMGANYGAAYRDALGLLISVSWDGTTLRTD